MKEMLGQHSRTLGLGPERAMLFDQLFAGAHSPHTSLGSYRPLGPPGALSWTELGCKGLFHWKCRH